MRAVVNTHQAEAWNGYEGEHWARHQDRYETMLSAINEQLFRAAAVRFSDRVLDVGCGTGQTTRLAARQATEGHATGVDLSAPMLERARATAVGEGLANVTFVQGDAQVHPFPAAAFDLVISRGGIMYFADAVAAFANIGSALRSGGRMAFMAGGSVTENSESMVPFRALAGHVPQAARTAGDDSPSPDSLSDPARTRAILAEAGFADIRVEPLEAPLILGSAADDAAAFVLGWGPVHYDLTQAGITDTGPARSAVAEALRPYETPDGVRLRSRGWLVTAVRP